MNEQVLEYIKYGLWILFGSGLLFEITPIKIKPISFILSGIGKRLNRDVKDKLSEVETKVNSVQIDLQTHKIDGQRRDILNFSNKLMVNGSRSKEEFDFIIDLHDEYEKYLKENNLDNGKVDLAIQYIKKKYQECMDNNNFFVGR